MTNQLLDRQSDLLEVLIQTMSAQLAVPNVERNPDADISKLGEEWGMTHAQVVDTLVYMRLHLYNVMVQASQKRDSLEIVQLPLKMLADWLDAIPEVDEKVQDILRRSGTDGKGYVKVEMPAIVKECLNIQPQPAHQVVVGGIKPPQCV